METKPLGKTNLEVSRIGLGTVEIGIADYAVGQKGIVSEKEAINLLKTAVDMGITYIDTARAYGVAEERIGKSGIGTHKGVVVGTKCAQFLEKGEDPRGEELIKKIRSEVEESLTNLRTDTLQLVQIHGGSKEQIKRGEFIDILSTLKDEGKIQHAGIATRSEDAALAAIHTDFFETIQLAYNILDQRMAKHVLEEAHKKNIGIINRSVLLKGALTPKYENLPDALAPIKKVAKQATKIAEELDTTLPDLAIRFVLANQAVATALIGTSQAQEIESAITASENLLPEEDINSLYKLAISDPDQVDPSRWPKDTQTV